MPQTLPQNVGPALGHPSVSQSQLRHPLPICDLGTPPATRARALLESARRVSELRFSLALFVLFMDLVFVVSLLE